MPDPAERLPEYLDAAHEISRHTLETTLRVAKERDLEPGTLVQLVHSHLMGTGHVLMWGRAREQRGQG